ncbi:MAG: NAD(P)H-dependent oxidoreductase [Henriciella sp.]|nr:NAD(P)H-dependent oxidoreductase [Henriciella sp.]
MSTKIFIWVGHPRETSLSLGLADAYQRGAESQGAEIRRMNIHDMDFDPDLTHGYAQRKEHEPCLVEFIENIKWADHMAWFHPLWWGGMPAKMQGAIDRAFLPGIAFAYHDNDPWWDKLLEGRTADVVVNADTPGFFLKFMYGNAHKHRITKQILGFTGVKVTNYNYFAPAKTASEAKIKGWMEKVYKVGAEAGRR